MRVILAACLIAMGCGGDSGDGDYECTGNEARGVWEATIQGRDDCAYISGTSVIKAGDLPLGADCESEVVDVDACTSEVEQTCYLQDGQSFHGVAVRTWTGPDSAIAVVTVQFYDERGSLEKVCTADLTYRRP